MDLEFEDENKSIHLIVHHHFFRLVSQRSPRSLWFILYLENSDTFSALSAISAVIYRL